MTRYGLSGLTLVFALLLASGLQTAARADDSPYATCFAFDPVFVQADHRSMAQAPAARPPAREPKPEGRAAPPRLSLASLRATLRGLRADAEKTAKSNPTARRGRK